VQEPADSASASGSSRSRCGASCPFCGHGAHPAAGQGAESGAAGGGEQGAEAVPHVPQQVRLFGSSFVGESELPSPFQSYGSLSFGKFLFTCCGAWTSSDSFETNALFPQIRSWDTEELDVDELGMLVSMSVHLLLNCSRGLAFTCF
jgi:hypothetical protein